VRSPRKPRRLAGRDSLRASSLRCLRRRGTTSGRPLSVPPRFCCWVSALHRLAGVYVPAHRSPRSALRVARDRPFRACGRSPHRPRPFRAKMNLVSTPALHPFGSSGPRLRRPRRTWLRRGERGMRWPLAPAGRRAVLVGATSCRRALARAQGALAKARARARRWFCRSVSSENRDVAASRCRRVRAFGLW